MAQTLPLQGRVAVVTGASRGAGRGIAQELGAAGATVVVTGRSTRQQQPADYRQLLALSKLERLPGSIDDTAEQVTQLRARAREQRAAPRHDERRVLDEGRVGIALVGWQCDQRAAMAHQRGAVRRVLGKRQVHVGRAKVHGRQAVGEVAGRRTHDGPREACERHGVRGGHQNSLR